MSARWVKIAVTIGLLGWAGLEIRAEKSVEKEYVVTQDGDGQASGDSEQESSDFSVEQIKEKYESEQTMTQKIASYATSFKNLVWGSGSFADHYLRRGGLIATAILVWLCHRKDEETKALWTKEEQDDRDSGSGSMARLRRRQVGACNSQTWDDRCAVAAQQRLAEIRAQFEREKLEDERRAAQSRREIESLRQDHERANEIGRRRMELLDREHEIQKYNSDHHMALLAVTYEKRFGDKTAEKMLLDRGVTLDRARREAIQKARRDGGLQLLARSGDLPSRTLTPPSAARGVVLGEWARRVHELEIQYAELQKTNKRKIAELEEKCQRTRHRQRAVLSQYQGVHNFDNAGVRDLRNFANECESNHRRMILDHKKLAMEQEEQAFNSLQRARALAAEEVESERKFAEEMQRIERARRALVQRYEGVAG